MSALLPLKIETAASHTVFDVLAGNAVTWTDISDDVLYAQGVNFTRGRPAESTSTSPGTCTFTVKTAHDGSTVDLPLRRPVRVSWYAADDYDALAELYETYDDYAAAVAAYEDADGTGTWYPLWTGSISEVRHGWQAGVRGVQQVVATDNISVAERTVLEGWPAAVALSIGSVGWAFPLDDADLESFPREVSGAANPPQLRARGVGVPPEDSAVRLGVGVGPGFDGSVAEFTNTTAAGGWCLEAFDALGQLPNGGVGDATVSVFVWIDEYAARDTVALSLTYAHYGEFLRLDVGIAASGYAYAGWTLSGGTTESLNGTTGLSRGRWHHLAVRIDVDPSTLFYDVDLFVNGTSQDSYAGFNGPYNLGQYGVRIGAGFNDVAAFKGRISHAALFTAALSDTQVADLAASADGYAGDSTVGRFNRIQRLVDFTASTASGGIGVMGRQPIAGKTVAAALADCATVEHAPFYTTPSGTLALLSRDQLWNNMEITYVSGSPFALLLTQDVELPAEAVAPNTTVLLDDKTLANVVTGTRTGGLTYTATSTSSVAAYGSYAKSTVYPCGSDGEMTTYVDADLAANAAPRYLSESLTVDVVAAAASIQIGDVLDAEVGDLLRVNDLPDDGPIATSSYFRIVGMADRTSPRGWARTYNTEFIGSIASLLSPVLATSGSPVAWVWKLDDANYPLGARTATTFDTRLGL